MRWIRRWAAAAIIVVILMVVGQYALPKLVERRIEVGLERSFDDVKFVDAQVEAYPAVILLGGRLTSINLDLRRVTMGDLTLDAVLLDGRNLTVDVRRLVAGEGVTVRSADSLKATFVIGEEDLNRYFWARVNESQFFSVALERGRAVLEGSIRLLGRLLNVTVAGHFLVEGGANVSFVPQEVTVQNTRVPQLLLDLIAEEWTIPLDLDQEAIPLVITDLLVEDGKLLIYGTHPAGARDEPT